MKIKENNIYEDKIKKKKREVRKKESILQTRRSKDKSTLAVSN